MNELIEIINEITKYGLNPNLEVEDKETDLEKNLLKIDSKFFEIEYEFDNKDYPDFKKVKFPNVIENVKTNFLYFGFYHKVLNCYELNKDALWFFELIFKAHTQEHIISLLNFMKRKNG